MRANRIEEPLSSVRHRAHRVENEEEATDLEDNIFDVLIFTMEMKSDRKSPNLISREEVADEEEVEAGLHDGSSSDDAPVLQPVRLRYQIRHEGIS